MPVIVEHLRRALKRQNSVLNLWHNASIKGHCATRYGSEPAVVSVICLWNSSAGCFWYASLLLAPALHHICIRGNDAAEYLLSMCRQRWSHKSMGKKGSKEQQEYYSVSLLQKANNNGAVMNEVRQNKATKEWVIYATSRGNRPHDFQGPGNIREGQPPLTRIVHFVRAMKICFPSLIIMETPMEGTSSWQTTSDTEQISCTHA